MSVKSWITYERKQTVLVFCSIFIASIDFLMDTWAGSITWQLQCTIAVHEQVSPQFVDLDCVGIVLRVVQLEGIE